MRPGALLFLFLVGISACSTALPPLPSPDTNKADSAWLPPLPAPVANNAVAGLSRGERVLLFSFLGLGAGKSATDTRSDAWMLEVQQTPRGAAANMAMPVGNWQRLADVPGPGGRLAATAVSVAGKIFLFGGYTVADDGSEQSVPLVHRLDPDTLEYHARAPMPVPVDDTVSLVYQDRYVYLVSGWHDTDNVDLVQVYDTQSDHWFEATAFPGPPVFGHAGGIVQNKLVVCDGVQLVVDGQQRSFKASPHCFLGVIDPDQPARIDWQKIAHYPHHARYRMAASAAGGKIYFAGGSDNPYNYNGIGYDGVPSAPSAAVYAYDMASGQWQQARDLLQPSMDHRGMIRLADGFVLVGGMGEKQQVLARTVFYRPQ